MSPSATETAFVDTLFTTLLTLLEDARTLIGSGRMHAITADLPAEARMVAARDLSKLTSQGTAAMSVLLMYKALQSGQADEIEDPATQLEELYGETVRNSGEPESYGPVVPAALVDLRRRGDDIFGKIGEVRSLILRHLGVPG
ncbi:hypothetical protein [Novispirillum itersonii]|uniref:hypothetical protein n=1 Tax=Novispirillum itersonii TaxID=189 RepID=UPI000382B396|nr:hypothetical protein [Novispirillum itersonii]